MQQARWRMCSLALSVLLPLPPLRPATAQVKEEKDAQFLRGRAAMIDEMEAMLLGPSLWAINRKMQPYLHYLVPRPDAGKQQQQWGPGQEGQQWGGKTVGPGAGGGRGDGPRSSEGAAEQQLLGCNREELRKMMLEVLQEWQQQQQLQVMSHFMPSTGT